MDSKFVDRLSKIYVQKLIGEGNDKARLWAERFLNKESVVEVAEQVKVLLKKRGFKVKE